MRRIAGLIAVLSLAGCSSDPKPAQTAKTAQTAPAPKPVLVGSPRPALAPSAPPQSHVPAAPSVEVAVDQCGAWELADLIGKPRTEIPIPINPGQRRVYCTSCMVTQDYDPTRLNVMFDSRSGLITEVKCG